MVLDHVTHHKPAGSVGPAESSPSSLNSFCLSAQPSVFQPSFLFAPRVLLAVAVILPAWICLPFSAFPPWHLHVLVYSSIFPIIQHYSPACLPCHAFVLESLLGPVPHRGGDLCRLMVTSCLLELHFKYKASA